MTKHYFFEKNELNTYINNVVKFDNRFYVESVPDIIDNVLMYNFYTTFGINDKMIDFVRDVLYSVSNIYGFYNIECPIEKERSVYDESTNSIVKKTIITYPRLSIYGKANSKDSRKMLIEWIRDSKERIGNNTFENLPNNEPDEKKFIENVYKLFPNASPYYFGDFLTSMRICIQNIYSNCLNDKTIAPTMKKMFYNYSNIGGTGKDIAMDRFKHYFDKIELPYVESYISNNFVGDEFAENFVVFIREMVKPSVNNYSTCIRLLNPIIDNEEYIVEHKGRDSYSRKSVATIFTTSNVLPFDMSNTRRYGIARMNEISIAKRRNEFEKYLDLNHYNDYDYWDKVIESIFKYCPFDKDWDNIVKTQNEETSDLISKCVELIQHNVENMENMTITDFVKNYNSIFDGANDFNSKKHFKHAVYKAILNIEQDNPTLRIYTKKRYGDEINSSFNFVKIANLFDDSYNTKFVENYQNNELQTLHDYVKELIGESKKLNDADSMNVLKTNWNQAYQIINSDSIELIDDSIKVNADSLVKQCYDMHVAGVSLNLIAKYYVRAIKWLDLNDIEHNLDKDEEYIIKTINYYDKVVVPNRMHWNK